MTGSKISALRSELAEAGSGAQVGVIRSRCGHEDLPKKTFEIANNRIYLNSGLSFKPIAKKNWFTPDEFLSFLPIPSLVQFMQQHLSGEGA